MYDMYHNIIYYETSTGFWWKAEYNKDRKRVYYEHCDGTIQDTRCVKENMMIVFLTPNKFNFVDENNVLVGYDNESDCCECFGYFFSEQIVSDYNEIDKLSIELSASDTQSYRFDTTFFKRIKNFEDGSDENADDPDQNCDFACFKLYSVKTGQADIYLHLYNYHNGYYSHGFDSQQIENEVVQEWVHGRL